jgi:hypothetical protein
MEPAGIKDGFHSALLHKWMRDSLFEIRVLAGRHEQLFPFEVQDQELAFVQHGAEGAWLPVDLV